MGIFVTQWRSEFPGQSIRASRGQASCPSSDCGRCAQTLHQFLWPVSVRLPVNPGHRSLPELQERTTQLHTPTVLPCSDDSLLLFSSTFSLQPKQDRSLYSFAQIMKYRYLYFILEVLHNLTLNNFSEIISHYQ